MAELDAFSSSAMQQGAAYDALSLSKHGDGPIPAMYKLGAAALFFVEALVGMLLPVLLTAPSSSRQWALSLLNCFAGGVFLSAGEHCTITRACRKALDTLMHAEANNRPAVKCSSIAHAKAEGCTEPSRKGPP